MLDRSVLFAGIDGFTLALRRSHVGDVHGDTSSSCVRVERERLLFRRKPSIALHEHRRWGYILHSGGRCIFTPLHRGRLFCRDEPQQQPTVTFPHKGQQYVNKQRIPAGIAVTLDTLAFVFVFHNPPAKNDNGQPTSSGYQNT